MDTRQRQVLFISHANPEDNAAAAWFATRLTMLGYEVWCDLKDSHGGESAFWLKVQQKIEQDAAKFIFILSDTSRDFERKRGIYKEVQAADNLGRDNFILPVRIEPLTGSLPIHIGPDIYINAENWMSGLQELCERLEHDGVPKAAKPDLEKIASWWPAVSAENALVVDDESELVSNVFGFRALPEKIHFLKVLSDGNLLSGHSMIRKAIGRKIANYPHGDHAISFGCAHDFLELTDTVEIEDTLILRTADFLEYGHPPLGITPQTARNALTFLIASAFEHACERRGLQSKSAGRSPRKIWYPADGFVKGNKHSFAEPGKRKSPTSFVGRVRHFKKEYVWHFGVQPAIDLRVHHGIVFSPKAVLSEPYDYQRGDVPVPVDEKKALKKLGWWNNQWRQKVLGFASWLAHDEEIIRIPAGYQEILLEAHPNIFLAERSYRAMSDSALMDELLEGME